MLDPGPKIRTTHSYDSYEFLIHGSRGRKTHHTKPRNRHSAGLTFSYHTPVEDDSDICSPPLWKTSPDRKRSPSPQPSGNGGNYQCLSPASRARAIARGQKELMDIVRSMPESCYELSLKDLVEQQAGREGEVGEAKYLLERENLERGNRHNVRKRQVHRSDSMENGGFLLKMMTPVSLGSKGKKKSNSDTSFIAKGSPKSDGSGKGVEREWWKKKENESGGSKSSSSSSSSRNSSRHSSKGTGCWSFLGM